MSCLPRVAWMSRCVLETGTASRAATEVASDLGLGWCCFASRSAGVASLGAPWKEDWLYLLIAWLGFRYMMNTFASALHAFVSQALRAPHFLGKLCKTAMLGEGEEEENSHDLLCRPADGEGRGRLPNKTRPKLCPTPLSLLPLGNLPISTTSVTAKF